jgi:hypothetical protein
LPGPDVGDSGYAAPQQHIVAASANEPLTFASKDMINVILAAVPLVFATGALVWTMTSGARAQMRSDAWARQWMRDNA